MRLELSEPYTVNVAHIQPFPSYFIYHMLYSEASNVQTPTHQVSAEN